MLIGIDMLGVQSPGSGARESGRLGRQLVSALLARDSADRFLLYTHDGLPTDRVPTSRNALRVALAETADGRSRSRPSLQRVLDRNPDGLDWLVLLDPFDAASGGMPPETPLNGLKVASLITNLAPGRVDDGRLATLRKHDAILAYSEATAAECRQRMPTASHRIHRIGLALDDSWLSFDSDSAGPLGLATAQELGRLGISGPFLFANMAAGSARSNLGGVLEAYHRLPLELQKGYQLVVAGEVDDPWAAVAYLHDRGCAEGLVLVGPVDEPTLRTLYGRSAVFLSPSFAEAPDLSMIEALSQGAAVIAGRAGSQPDLIADAGLLADPLDPSEIADQVTRVLSDVDLGRELKAKARRRSASFTWEPVVGAFFGALRGRDPVVTKARLRFDRPHVNRPRVAVFAASLSGSATIATASHDLNDRVARACRDHYDVDVYVEPGDAATLGRLPIDLGGFDVRQFGRNDEILDYHAVVYLLPDVFALKAKIGRLEGRPGLVILRDETSIDRIEAGSPGTTGSSVADIEAEVACQRLRELFFTSSRLGVRSPRTLAAIRASFPSFADQVVLLPESAGPGRSGPRLDGLIEGNSAGVPGRPWRKGPGRMLGSPRATSGLDDSYLEAR